MLGCATNLYDAPCHIGESPSAHLRNGGTLVFFFMWAFRTFHQVDNLVTFNLAQYIL